MSITPAKTMLLKPKSPLFILFSLWLIVQAVLLYKNGIITTGESKTYISEAQNLTTVGFLSSRSYFLYFIQILLLAFAFKSGIGYWFVAAVQLIFSFTATFALYRLAARLFSFKTAITCTILFLFNYPLQELNFYLQTESLFFSFTIIYTAYLLQLSRLTLFHFFIILFSLALICITRPTGLLFIPATFLYLFFGFLKTISTKLKLLTVAAITVAFLFLVNAALGSGGGLDFMLPFLDERIICGVPTLHHFVDIKTAPNGNSLYGLLYYITHNFEQFIRLALLRSKAFFGLMRDYFNIGHNIFLALFFYPFYVLITLSTRWWLKNNLYQFLYLSCLIIFTWGATMLTCDDWHNRWFLSISPWLIFLSLPAINKLFAIFTFYGNKFNNQIFNKETLVTLNGLFNNNTPIRHIVIDNFLENQIAHDIYKHFPTLSAMKTHYKGLNENKSEDSNFSDLDNCFTVLHNALSSKLFLNWIYECTGINNCTFINDRLGYGLHQGGNNSFLDIHIDYNIHPIRNLYRKLNLILFFNPVWEANWGGHLELWDSEVKNCIQSIAPLFNRCVIFECSDISYHGYSKIAVPEYITRKSYYQYYFITVSEEVTYHDTIFRTRPKESVIKKVATPLKEFAKNSAKRILLKAGMKRFLK